MNRFVKRTAILVLAVAVAVGIINGAKPELFLRLPGPYGFILWAITGHQIPPFFDNNCYAPSEFKKWTRPGDVFISTGAKSGTNWMLYTSHLIRVKGNLTAHPYLDVLANTPWMGAIHYPGQTCQQVIAAYSSPDTITSDGIVLKNQWDHPDYPFRVMKAHETPIGMRGGVLPVDENPHVRFVAMVRNTPDVIRSFMPFFASHDETFRADFGGFPPIWSSQEEMFKDLLPGGTLDGFVWDYARGWWAFRDRPNVLLLSYESALRDFPDTVSKLANFMGVSLTPDELAIIVHMASFAEMKKVDSQFNYRRYLNKANDLGTLMKDGTLLRAGKSGQGKEFFSRANMEMIQATMEQEFKDPALLAFVKDGVPWK